MNGQWSLVDADGDKFPSLQSDTEGESFKVPYYTDKQADSKLKLLGVKL